MRRWYGTIRATICILVGIALLVLVGQVFLSTNETTHQRYIDNPVVRQAIDIQRQAQSR